MECPICKNRMGFVCGTCIDCGFNQHTGQFDRIEISTKILKAILSDNEELYYQLIDEHEKHKSR